jgi:mRNA interferase MazF
MSDIKRGDIYYVESNYSVGSEQRAGRPAVIVSNEKNNEFSSIVELVYLTTQPKNDLPTHVQVHGTGRTSIALCEQVHTVDTQRLGNYCGCCTEQEMLNIDIALMVSLGLDVTAGVKEKVVEVPVEVVKEVIKEVPAADSGELVAVKAQLSLVQSMYNDLLRQTMTLQLGKAVTV